MIKDKREESLLKNASNPHDQEEKNIKKDTIEYYLEVEQKKASKHSKILKILKEQ